MNNRCKIFTPLSNDPKHIGLYLKLFIMQRCISQFDGCVLWVVFDGIGVNTKLYIALNKKKNENCLGRGIGERFKSIDKV